MFAKRIEQLHSSPTLALEENVRLLESHGISVVNLGIGEPDFGTPWSIRFAAIAAIVKGFTHYTATSGIVELRTAVCKKLFDENKVFYHPSEIVIGVGTKQLLYHAFQVLCDSGDEVIVPVPTWSTYAEQVRLSGATPVFVTLEPPFRLTAAALEKSITSKTKAIVLNSPANPTGAIIEEEELIKIAEIAVEKNIIVISDEIYEKIIFGRRHVSIASLNEEIKARTVTINGFSKSYAMTGWRVGFAAGPKHIIDAMVALQSQTTSSTSSISQKAACAALTHPQKSVEAMRTVYRSRRDFLAAALAKTPQLSFTLPDGAFYFFVDISPLLGKQFQSAVAWCQALLDEERVAVVPAETFLYKNYIRLSFAVPIEELQEGIKRIERFVKKYE
ncbi:MAG: pyridoxal phosphate-dependent aminotransferase [Patescibacteria group bacterium]